MKRILVLAFACLCHSIIQSQDLALNSFSGIDQNEKVLLVWELSAGSVCNGISVQRATKDLHFKEIGKVEGVCGSPTIAVKFEFQDIKPLLNQKSYYRLNFGGNEFSDTLVFSVIGLAGENYILNGNPLSDNSFLVFENNNFQQVSLCIYNGYGSLLRCEETQSNTINLKASEFESGLYFFVLTGGNKQKKVNGKFLVP